LESRVNLLAKAANGKFKYLFDNIGDWKDDRKLQNPVEIEELKQTQNRLSNISESFDITEEPEEEELNPSFYESQSEILQENQVVQQNQQQEEEEQDPEAREKLDANLRDIDFLNKNQLTSLREDQKVKDQKEEEEENKITDEILVPQQNTKISSVIFVPPPKKDKEHIATYNARNKYFNDKLNNVETSAHADKKWGPAFRKYLANKEI
jgi:hypothetical protein